MRNHRKTRLAIVLVLTLIFTMCMTACGGSSKKLQNAGFYGFYSMEQDGEAFTAAEMEELGIDLSGFYLWLAEDGTGELAIFDEENEALTWDDSSITVDGDKEEYTLENGLLTIEADGIEIVFQYKGSEKQTSTASAAVEEPDVVDEEPEVEEEETVVEETASSEEVVSASESSEEESAPAAAADFTPVSGSGDGFDITVVGAEKTVDYDGNTDLRVYFDITNTSDEIESVSYFIWPKATQDGFELLNTSPDEEVPEDDNYYRSIQPGVTIRATYNFIYQEGKGDVTVNMVDWYDNGAVATFNPDNLPGAPAEALERVLIPEPTFYADAPSEANYEGLFSMTFEEPELHLDQGYVKVSLSMTNLSGEEITSYTNGYFAAYQDGIELDITYSVFAEDDENETYDPIAAGETKSVVEFYVPESDSPIEFVYHCYEDDVDYAQIIPLG